MNWLVLPLIVVSFCVILYWIALKYVQYTVRKYEAKVQADCLKILHAPSVPTREERKAHDSDDAGHTEGSIARIATPTKKRPMSTPRRRFRSTRKPARRSPFAPLQIGTKILNNRLIKAGTYEAGCDINGVPEISLLEFHEKMAAGGVGECACWICMRKHGGIV